MATRVTVGYTFVDSPIGRLFAAVSGAKVVRVGFPDEDPGAMLQEIEERITHRIDEARLPDVHREFTGYFEGRVRRFSLMPDWALVPPGFERRVLRATGRIPYGAVATYGEVAADAGSPRAARAAGNALNRNPIPLIVPCHRVVPAAGGVGGYAGHEDRKAFLLTLEGRSRI